MSGHSLNRVGSQLELIPARGAFEGLTYPLLWGWPYLSTAMGPLMAFAPTCTSPAMACTLARTCAFPLPLCCHTQAMSCPALPHPLQPVIASQGPYPAIIVGNAQRELLDWYMAQLNKDARIVRTTAPTAAGILEGLARHGLM